MTANKHVAVSFHALRGRKRVGVEALRTGGGYSLLVKAVGIVGTLLEESGGVGGVGEQYAEKGI